MATNGQQSRKLTPRQQRFVEEYLVDLNATQAAIRSGYAKGTANREGSRLLSNVDIQAAIELAMAERSERVDVDADYVVKGLKTEAELTGEGASHSARVAALSQLGKHLGMFTQKLEHTVTSGKSHIHKSDAQLMADLRSFREDRRIRMANKAELEELRELRKLKLKDSPSPN